MDFVPTGHRPIKSRHFYQAGDNLICEKILTTSGCRNKI
jgi:hypothetical protein